MEKKKITIEVDPDAGVVALGILQLYLRANIEDFKNTADTPSDGSGPDLLDWMDKMEEFLYEVYDRCAEVSSLREYIDTMTEVYQVTGGFGDNTNTKN